MLNKEEHDTLLNKVKDAQDDSERMAALIELQKNYDNDLNNYNKKLAELETVKKERDNYAVLNNKLWLENSAAGKDNESNNGNETPGEKKKLNFTDLKF